MGDEPSPTLLYLNLQALNTREPRRIHIAPPDGNPETDPALTTLVALRIIPSYDAPRYSPILFCVGDERVFQVSFSGEAPLTHRQSETLGVYDLVKAPLEPVQLPGRGGACRAFLLVKQVLSELQAPTCARELRQLLLQPVQAPCIARFDALDQAWIWAIKWARANRRLDDGQQTQLAVVRKLYHHVRQRYEERMGDVGSEKIQIYVETTLKNILDDYRFCAVREFIHSV